MDVSSTDPVLVLCVFTLLPCETLRQVFMFALVQMPSCSGVGALAALLLSEGTDMSRPCLALFGLISGSPWGAGLLNMASLPLFDLRVCCHEVSFLLLLGPAVF